MNNKQIAEALKLQPLSEDDKSKRHILGRLYGPIATSKTGTRNGRKYNRQLWETALEDELFAEKLDNKSLFLELGHPTDRTETDMTKICACIPEMPKIVNGDLYAYVDILDTPNGKLLKTLCDYGFIPGISSRGSGDIMDNNEVDPETFMLETWDIVQLPAVKEARLAMCESVDIENIKMKKALTESIDNANEEEKKIMEETLNNLNISLDESKINEETLTESDDLNSLDKMIDVIKKSGYEINIEDNKVMYEESLKEEVEDPEIESEITDDVEETSLEDTEENIENTTEEENTESTNIVETNTVEALITGLQNLSFKKDAKVITNPVEIDGKIYETDLTVEQNDDGDLIIGVNCIPTENTEESSDDIEEVATEEPIEVNVEENSEPVDDIEDEEVIEQLKEMVRQKDKLETEIKTLKSEKAVGDSKVEKLEEELTKYKNSFERMNAIAAANNKKSVQKVKELTEQLTQKDQEIKNLKQTQQVNLNEGLKESVNRSNRLTEELETVRKELKELNDTKAQLNEQLESYKRKVNERSKVAMAYKTKFNEALNAYVNHRASLLGVKVSEITSKLNENYSIADVDNACESLLTENVNISKLPFGLTKNSKVRINETKVQTPVTKQTDGYDIDDSLLELAGLK